MPPTPYKRGNVYWLRLTTSSGLRKRVSLRCRDKGVALQKAAQILRDLEAERAGVADPYVIAHRRGIAEHFAEFERSMRGGERHTGYVLATLRGASSGMQTLGEFSADSAARWLEAQRIVERRSITSLNHYTRHLRQFGRWLAKSDRVKVDPFRTLAPYPVPAGGDRGGDSFDRRALSSEEARALLAASPEPRRTVYLLALTTGLRRGELAQLRRDSVDFERQQLEVRAGTAKNRQRAHLPLAPEVLEALRTHFARTAITQELQRLQSITEAVPSKEQAAALAGCSRSTLARRLRNLEWLAAAPEPVLAFPGGRWCYPEGRGQGVPTVPRLHADAAAAGVEVTTAAGLLDFHALRTTFATSLARANVPLVHAQALMRHSSPVLTQRFYTRVEGTDSHRAVAAVVQNLWPSRQEAPQSQNDTQATV